MTRAPTPPEPAPTLKPDLVSLLPSATDLIFALGLGGRLAGVSHSCDHPGTAGRPVLTRSVVDPSLPAAEIDRAVGEALREGRPLYEVNWAGLRALKPALVVTQDVCEVCAVSASSFDLGAGHTAPACPAPETPWTTLSLSGTSLGGILADLEALGEATGTADRARALADEARARWERLPGANTSPPLDRRPRVLTLEWTDPPFYGGHWVPEQVEQAGGASVLGRPGVPSGRTTWEAAQRGAPEVVVVMACGYGLSENVALARALDLGNLPGAQVWAVDANALFSRPSLGVVRGAEVLSELLRGVACPGESLRTA